MSPVQQGLRALIIGPPGAGKGTLSSRLFRDLPSIRAISSGDILRENIAQGSMLGKAAEKAIAKGELVSDDLMLKLVGSLMLSQGLTGPGTQFMLDGFPRTSAQARMLDHSLAKYHTGLNCVLWLNVPFQELISRVTQRWIHQASGRVYNLSYNPPSIAGKDDVTGEPLVARVDDTAELFAKRYQLFLTQTMPLLDYYRERGILHEFQGTSSDAIYSELYSTVIETIHQSKNCELSHTSLDDASAQKQTTLAPSC